VLILDEPTAGVDVTLRRSFWEFIREIHQAGTTVILTTHYLVEAEEHCDRIAILDQGRVVAMDTRENLLSLVGKKQVCIDLCEPLSRPIGPVEGQMAKLEDGGKRIIFQIDPRCGELNLWLEALRATGVQIADITLRTPDLEDVFFKLTGTGGTGTTPNNVPREQQP
jgi:ABC-2 type transport system ATP-binding protein